MRLGVLTRSSPREGLEEEAALRPLKDLTAPSIFPHPPQRTEDSCLCFFFLSFIYIFRELELLM